MPKKWNDRWVCSSEELVPSYYSNIKALQQQLYRYASKPYGIKRVQLGGNGRQMLIDYDSLPQEIKNAIKRIKDNA